MRRIVFLLVISSFSVVPLVAQSPTGTISGIVHDPSGAVIAGAEVIVVNDATGVQYSTTTNGEGIYLVPNLPPGPYRLQVAKVGFETLIKPDIVLNVQDALAINFTLPVGAASVTVTVKGGAPLINTQSGAVSTVIDRQFVENLPLNGRSFNTLLQLTPGVVVAPSTPGAPGQFSINGQRTDANNFTIDGVSANFGVAIGENVGESGTGGAPAFTALGGTSSLVSVDDLQEFRIETSSFAPEFGRTPGGQVILTTRSGTNDFHGEVFDYLRNTVMDANDWFANQGGVPRAPEHHNDFGGILGGPIRKNKTFFFLSYEGARLELPQTSVVNVPSAFARANASPALAPYLNAYPQPNGVVIPGAYTTSFTGSFANTATINATSVRIDHTLNDRFSIFGRYNDAPSQSLQRPDSPSDRLLTTVNTRTVTVGANMLLRPTVTNALRGNYSEQASGLSYSLDSLGGAVPLSPGLLLGSLPIGQNLGLFDDFDTKPYLVGQGGRNLTKQFDFGDDVGISIGSHQLKFGGDYRAIFLDANAFQHEIVFVVPSVQNFLSSGSASLATSVFLPTKFLINSLSLYAQDTWKVTPRLSLTYGLRWELSPAPIARGNTTLSAFENVDDAPKTTLAPMGTSLWATTYADFAPRFGLAYNLTRDDSFVLRMGAGIFYDLGVGSSANLAFNFPNSFFMFTPGVSVPVTDVTPYLPAVSLQPPFPDGVQGFSPDLKLPRSYQMNLALEKSFGGRQALAATYVFQAGRDLLRQKALFQPNANFSGALDLTENDARSNYNALQLQYRRPLSGRLQALLNYTWAHSLDNASNDSIVGLSSTIISAANDYASSNFDVRQSFSSALTYDVPSVNKIKPLSLLTKNWSLDAVVVARTGFPFNAQVFAPSPIFGVSFLRPDIVPGQPLWLSNRAAPGGRILNSNAFSIPLTLRQGDEARNDIPGFGLTEVDLSIERRFPITERLDFRLRADAFNLFNHPNFTNPLADVQFGSSFLQSESMLNQGLGGLNPLFQEGGPRSLQLSLKMTF